MSTDVSRGPKVCPSCGKENPPAAAHVVPVLRRAPRLSAGAEE